jgi:large subunit ribosomal protein L28
MPCADDVSGADNSNPQFLVVSLRHSWNAIADLANWRRFKRAKFDRATPLPFKIRLDPRVETRQLTRLFRIMSKVCSITGARATRGSIIHRRGMAKKKGGVGRHVTKNVPRVFAPNLHEHRIWVPELKKFVRLRVTARGLKTINKNGAYRALKRAGVI